MWVSSGLRQLNRSVQDLPLVTEPGAELAAVHTAITELAPIVAGAWAAFGGAGRAGNQQETAEKDLLSARSAIENACWENDLELVII